MAVNKGNRVALVQYLPAEDNRDLMHKEFVTDCKKYCIASAVLILIVVAVWGMR